MNHKIKINVNLGGRIYGIKVASDFEAIIRKAVRDTNEELKEFIKKYEINDEKDALSLILLKVVAENAEMKNKLKSFEEKWKIEMEKWKKLIENQ